ncbi:hypothetical protein [Limosilactobacillus gastricus]|uniref:hypothetical protein n=1 Tax=Limosilactobacillus gastricus TaxID=227942 RepID=UPI000304D47B|nr:hypothetical protein [Limosilactobacillus gastricus]
MIKIINWIIDMIIMICCLACLLMSITVIWLVLSKGFEIVLGMLLLLAIAVLVEMIAGRIRR